MGSMESRQVISSLLHLARRVYWSIPLPQSLRIGLSKIKSKLVRRARVAPEVSARFAHVPPPEIPLASIRFEDIQAPLVSIIVPAYGNLAVTSACVRSIYQNAPRVPFELIVMEDASRDPAIGDLRQVRGLRYQENSTNLGFVGTCNAAAQLARGEYLHFLNNDTIVCPGWLDALVAVFETRVDCGLAGSALIYPDGRLQEAGGILWRNGSAANYGRGRVPETLDVSYLRRVDYCSGASILVRRAEFIAMGGFDPVFAPAYYEDADLAMKVRAAGRQVYYEPRSVVYHFEGSSNGTDERAGVKAYQALNRPKFVRKWADQLTAQPDPSVIQAIAKDQGRSRPVVLVLDNNVPQPDQDAGSRSTRDIMRCLVDQGAIVKFHPHNQHTNTRYAPLLGDEGVEIVGCDGGLEPWLDQWRGEIDVVLLNRPHVAESYLTTVRKRTSAKVIYYGHDIHFRRLEMQATVTGQDRYATMANRVRALEQGIWSAVDAVYYPSIDEVAEVTRYLEENQRPGRAHRIPVFAYDHISETEDIRGRQDLLFVGGFEHEPNVDGVTWLAREILPELLRAFPSLVLNVVGSKAPSAISELANDHVKVLGGVSDDELASLYAKSRVVVAPLRFGGGVKGKVVEAMARGVPCVTTPTGAQGMEAPGDALSIVATASEFVEATSLLLADDDAWRARSSSGLDYARAHFSVDVLREALRKEIPIRKP